MEEIVKKERDYSLDFIRVLGALAVVMIHASCYYAQYSRVGSIERIFGSIFCMLSRFGVPFFVMISGALILDENKTVTFHDVFFKYLRNIVFLIIFWSVFYAIQDVFFEIFVYGGKFSLKIFAIRIIYAYYHMWYLYMLAGLYLITPILKVITKKENAKTVLYFIILSMLFQFTEPVLLLIKSRFGEAYYLIRVINSLRLDFLSAYVGYYLIGWYLVHVGLPKKVRIGLYVAGVIGLVTSIICCCMSALYEYTNESTNLLIALYSIALFVFCRQTYKCKPKFNNVIKSVAGLTFGVYIIHPFLINLINLVFVYEKYFILYVVAYWIIIVVTSFIVTYVISKIPFVKKIVRV